MQVDYTFAVSHPEFYESLDRFPTDPLYANCVRELVSSAWSFSRSGPWLNVSHPDSVVPAQGFKIHVSSIHRDACGVLGIVVPECVRRTIAFKLAADPGLLGVLNAKGYDRGGGGKFMTLYPPDQASFEELLETLYKALQKTSFEGPYILSDRRFRDSKVLYYRYGGMRPLQRLAVDGTRFHLLVGPDGSLVKDARPPFFKLPPWVHDPFPEGEAGASPRPLAGRFEVQSVIATSNRGGVYVATDLHTGQAVILKEVRPHVNRMTSEGVSMDGLDFLRNEAAVLSRLRHLGHTPRPILLFQEWEHLFLAQEKIEGMGLKRFMAQHENLTLAFLHHPELLQGFVPKFAKLATSLIEAVEQIHRLGIVLGDLSINNIIVDPVRLRAFLIDLESAVAVEENLELAKLSFHWYTPGYARPERARSAAGKLHFADDLYALGMVLLNMFVGGAQFTILQPQGKDRLLDRLPAVGVPLDVTAAIRALFQADLPAARESVSRLPMV